MKKIFLIISFLITSFLCNAQIPDTCFTEKQTHRISEVIDSLKLQVEKDQQIIANYKILVQQQEKLIAIDSINLYFKDRQILLLEDNIDMYVKREKVMQPKWFEKPILFFVGGILTTVVTAKFVIESVNGG